MKFLKGSPQMKVLATGVLALAISAAGAMIELIASIAHPYEVGGVWLKLFTFTVGVAATLLLTRVSKDRALRVATYIVSASAWLLYLFGAFIRLFGVLLGQRGTLTYSSKGSISSVASESVGGSSSSYGNFIEVGGVVEFF